jgi:hypothetical protein
MMKNKLITGVLIFLFVGISNASAQNTPDSKCESYGFIRGTLDFAKCMQSESNKLEKRAQCNDERNGSYSRCLFACMSTPNAYGRAMPGECAGPCQDRAAQRYSQCMAD